MRPEHTEILFELGDQIRHLTALANTPGDPKLVLFFEEIERLNQDDAKALLAGAVLMLNALRKIT